MHRTGSHPATHPSTHPMGVRACGCAIGKCCKIHPGLHWRGLGKVCRSAFKHNVIRGQGGKGTLLSRSLAAALGMCSPLLSPLQRSINHLDCYPSMARLLLGSLQRKTEQGVVGVGGLQV